MTNGNSSNQQFLKKLDEIIEANLTNEKFTVPELASKMGMSRYTLHRKVVEATKLSVSQYIRQIRLKNAMKLLREKSLTVSEVAYKVGFNSPIYFSKCFHEYYGYPPNTVGQREDIKDSGYLVQSRSNRTKTFALASVFLVLLAFILFFIIKNSHSIKQKNQKKSVIVLFPAYNINDSVYLPQINGTIDAIVNNLSLIGDLTVFPISTSFKYRNSDKSAIEIARELKAGYVVETSGISYENQIRINIKIISASDGFQIWYKPYDVGINEIIKLPLDIARKIADEIHARITPDEIKRIDEKPTQNIDAWNYYLRGRDMLNQGLNLYYSIGGGGLFVKDSILGSRSLKEAAVYFTKAVEYDENFGLAYAQLAAIYYWLDIGNNDGKYEIELSRNADLAIINNPQHEMCLVAKAYDYVHRGESKLAVPFLEKAIQYNPKSVISYRLLANVYNLSREANTEKYLEYKLQVIKYIDIVDDVNQKSEDYRLAGRALRIAGFYNEAESFLDISLDYNPQNFTTISEKCENIIDGTKDYAKAREILLDALKWSSSKTEILRYLFTNYYLTRNFHEAYNYFKILLDENNNLSFLATKDFSRVSVMFAHLDMPNESEKYYQRFKESDRSKLNIYNRSIELIRLYSLENNPEKAIEQLKLLNELDYHFSYTIRMLKDDPAYDNLRELPEFNKIVREMENKFQTNQHRIKSNMENKKLM